MKTAFHRARGHTHDLRDLAFAEIFEESQHQYLAQTLRQPSESLPCVQLGVEGRAPVSAVSRGVGLQPCLLFGLEHVSSRAVAAQIVRDLEKPGREPSGRVEALPCAYDAQPGLLKKVVDSLGRSAAQEKPKEPLPVALQQVLERGRVAALHEDHEALVRLGRRRPNRSPGPRGSHRRRA